VAVIYARRRRRAGRDLIPARRGSARAAGQHHGEHAAAPLPGQGHGPAPDGQRSLSRPGDGQAVKTELVFEAPEHGRLKVSNPTQGAAAMSKSDLVSWGLFGLVYGAIVGAAARIDDALLEQGRRQAHA
jgi:hypothetical protein